VWKRHWRLTRDPFLDGTPPFVPTAVHHEAVARLVHTIESGQRRAIVQAEAGRGKSVVLARALAETKSPARRAALISSPTDGTSLLSLLAERLGIRVASGAGRPAAWKALADAVRLCRWQRLQVVLAIDDAQDLVAPADRLDLDRLVHLDPHPEARLTILAAYRTSKEDEERRTAWDLLIHLPALTRSETEQYVTAKLAAAGRAEPTFTPRSLHRLHAVSAGIPRGLERLASLALMAAAVRGLEMISPEIVEGVARECILPEGLAPPWKTWDASA
jgi:type II secretory pathway predicted ATPase ExeA